MTDERRALAERLVVVLVRAKKRRRREVKALVRFEREVAEARLRFVDEVARAAERCRRRCRP